MFNQLPSGKQFLHFLLLKACHSEARFIAREESAVSPPATSRFLPDKAGSE
jgi:hypothetical protein